MLPFGVSKKELRIAQEEKEDGKMHRRTLMTMAQELQNQDAYLKKLEKQLSLQKERTASSSSSYPE